MSSPLLHVENLEVSFPHRGGSVAPVRGVSFELRRGEIVGLVGESGSGKTLTALSCMQLAPPPGRVSADMLEFDGIDLMRASEAELRALRGASIAMIAQDPLTSLHPFVPIGSQISDALEDHGVDSAGRRRRVVQALKDVGLSDPEQQARRYAHQLSGGMRQRAIIALALANDPALVIADEPTTAVDAIVQAQLLSLLVDLRARRQLGVLLITHNMGVVASICDRVLVMYAGRIVESGPTSELLSAPQHPYTQALLQAVPRLHNGRGRSIGIPGSPPVPWARPSGCAFHPRCGHAIDLCSAEEPRLVPTPLGRLAACWVAQRGPLPGATVGLGAGSLAAPVMGEDHTVFRVRDVTRHFPSGPPWRREVVHALDGVNLDVKQGEALGIVGESGSGKSTLLRMLLLLDRPTSGRITFRDTDLTSLRGEALLGFRRRVQPVFQDPYSSLDPRYPIAESIREALHTHRVCPDAEQDGRIRYLLDRVGCPSRFAGRYPHELSGGERQRACIARAIAVQPEVLLADEPVSALDVSIQAQIIELFQQLRREQRFTLVMVAHDLALIREVSDRVVTLYMGKIVEDAPAGPYAEHPRHPYSFALAQATLDPSRVGWLPPVLATGDLPSALRPPPGCRFHTRCFKSQARCLRDEPPLVAMEGGRSAACFFPVEE